VIVLNAGRSVQSTDVTRTVETIDDPFGYARLAARLLTPDFPIDAAWAALATHRIAHRID